jgi:hypothetical protein
LRNRRKNMEKMSIMHKKYYAIQRNLIDEYDQL